MVRLKLLTMIYEFITPSDPITFKANSDKIAFFCALMLGQGKAGLKDENGAIELSPLLFLNLNAFEVACNYLGCSLSEYGDRHSDEIGDAFLSFSYGSINSRKEYDDAIEAITDPEKLKEFKEKHEDRNRSSLAQWVSQAWQIGEHFKNKNDEKHTGEVKSA